MGTPMFAMAAVADRARLGNNNKPMSQGGTSSDVLATNISAEYAMGEKNPMR
jgi:hypothetical protein